jgi:steroid delta-isomerase-like uncharacterized protein
MTANSFAYSMRWFAVLNGSLPERRPSCHRIIDDMTDDELADHYRAYLTALNERRFDDLGDFVHDELTYNDKPITRRRYADMIAGDAAAIPDLFFDAQLVVAAAGRVACRIVFDCVPQHDFLGFTPNGERLVFAEHVFYDFRDGRIAAVRSMIDRWAIQAQLSPGAPR